MRVSEDAVKPKEGWRRKIAGTEAANLAAPRQVLVATWWCGSMRKTAHQITKQVGFSSFNAPKLQGIAERLWHLVDGYSERAFFSFFA